MPGQVPGIYIAKSASYRTNYKMKMTDPEEGKSLVFAVHHIVEKNEDGASPARQVLWGGDLDKNRADDMIQPKKGSATGGVDIHINAPVNLVGLPSLIRQDGANRKTDENKTFGRSEKNEKEYAEQFGIIHDTSHPEGYYDPVNRIVVKAKTISDKKRLTQLAQYKNTLAGGRLSRLNTGAYANEDSISEGLNDDDVSGNASERLAVAVALRRIAMRLLNHEKETWANVLKRLKP